MSECRAVCKIKQNERMKDATLALVNKCVVVFIPLHSIHTTTTAEGWDKNGFLLLEERQ
jgi:hypothetical protein